MAGVSEHGGLWIEVAPGRIAELPAACVVARHDGREWTLQELDWEAFAPGDRIVISIVQESALDEPRVELVDWSPGPRGAFGPGRCLMPVERTAEVRTSLRIGAGKYQLDLPVTLSITNGLVSLNQDNELSVSEESGCRLLQGDTVLLGLDESNRLVILGFPNLRPVPDREKADAWSHELLSMEFRYQVQGQWVPDLPRTVALLRAAGGALPVTVEGLDRDGRLYYSRRYQRLSPTPKSRKLFRARYEGLLQDGRTALVRYGRWLLAIPMRSLISGLPEGVAPAAAEALSRSTQPIWIWREETGEFSFGHSPDNERALTADALCHVLVEHEGGQELGLICRSLDSGRLYWLAANRAAWIDLNTAELVEIFLGRQRRIFSAQVTASGGLSIVDMPAVDWQFKHLEIGRELAVRMLGRRLRVGANSAELYLAEIEALKLVLEVANYGGQELLTNHVYPVEVIRRTFGLPRLLLVAPPGTQPPQLDLPRWMLCDLPKPGSLRPKMEKLIDLVQSPRKVDDLRRRGNLSKLGEEHWLEILTLDASNEQGAALLQAEAAECWMEHFHGLPEFDAAPAIMSALLLDKGAEFSERNAYRWRSRARTLGYEIGRRALRSLHVEVFYRYWVADRGRGEDPDLLRHRLHLLEASLRRPQRKVIEDIVRFWAAAKMRKNDSLEALGEALLGAIGRSDDIGLLWSNAGVLSQLSQLAVTLPFSRAGFPKRLFSSHLRLLRMCLEEILMHRLDLTLLQPFEWPRRGSRTGAGELTK